MALNQRQQTLIAIAGFIVVVAAAYYYYLWMPAQATIVSVAAHADSVDSLNKIAHHDIASGDAAKLRADADKFGSELATMRHLVPTANEVPALLESISGAARESGLDVSEFSPDGVVIGTGFDIYHFKMGVTGSYHNVAAFFARVGSLERIVEPINVSVTPSGRVTDIKPRKNETFVDAHFDIQTYVAHTAGTVATPAVAK